MQKHFLCLLSSYLSNTWRFISSNIETDFLDFWCSFLLYLVKFVVFSTITWRTLFLFRILEGFQLQEAFISSISPFFDTLFFLDSFYKIKVFLLACQTKMRFRYLIVRTFSVCFFEEVLELVALFLVACICRSEVYIFISFSLIFQVFSLVFLLYLQADLYYFLNSRLLMLAGVGFGMEANSFHYTVGIQYNSFQSHSEHQLHV